jgi:iduronate 2-sulfatase
MLMIRTSTSPLLAACFVLTSWSATVPTATKPNVLLILVDDLKPALGTYGDPIAKSPNIDRLARRGMVFERAYTNQAVCAPSRNALLTGLRPTSTGIYDLGTNFRRATPDAVTLPQWAMRQGYDTEALGKIFHVGHGNHEDPASWSVPHWQAAVIAYALAASRAPQGLTREEALFSNVPFDEARQLPRGAAYEAADLADDAYPDGRLADEAIRRLQRAKAAPDRRCFWRWASSSRTCPSARRSDTGISTAGTPYRFRSGELRPTVRPPTRRSPAASSGSTARSRKRGRCRTIFSAR